VFLLVHPRQPMGNQRDSAPLAHPVRSECVFFGLNRATVYHRAEHIANTLGRLKSHSEVPGRRRPFGPHERKGAVRATPQKVGCIRLASPSGASTVPSTHLHSERPPSEPEAQPGASQDQWPDHPDTPNRNGSSSEPYTAAQALRGILVSDPGPATICLPRPPHHSPAVP
jgi:hypothetical protein